MKLIYDHKALEAAREQGVESMIAAAKGNLGVTYIHLGDFENGMDNTLYHQRFNISAGRVREVILSHYHVGMIFMHRGHLDRAEREILWAIKKCEESGSQSYLLSHIESMCTNVLMLSGRLEEARTHLENALSLVRGLGLQAKQDLLIFQKGLLLFALADYKELKKTVAHHNKPPEHGKDINTYYMILNGLYLISQQKTQEGLEQLDRAIDWLNHRKDYMSLFLNLYFCGQYLLKNSTTKQQACSYLKKTEDIATNHKMDGWLERLHRKKKNTPDIPLRIHCLGRLIIEHPVRGLHTMEQWMYAKPGQLLSVLIAAVVHNKKLDRDTIGALLWPNLSPAKMTNNFHVSMSLLKKHIGKNHIQFKGGLYGLDSVWIDAVEFRVSICDAEKALRQGKIHYVEFKLKNAMTLYKGIFMKDSYDGWLDELKSEFSVLHRKGLIMLGDIYLRKFKFDEAIETGKDILNDDPLNEQGHRFLMRSYILSGERAKAVSQYNKCEEILQRELQCEPSKETQQLYKDMM
jgi:two-component SAPR family response regulator